MTVVRGHRDRPEAELLIEEWTPLAYAIADRYGIPGGDRDDVRQEALIALWIAAKDFNAAAGVPFPSFARMVITRRLWTAVRLANGGKHQPLNRALIGEIDDGEGGDPIRLIEMQADPREGVAEHRARLRAVVAALPSLTLTERRALSDHLNGLQDWSVKSFDNALVRARKKLRDAA